MLKPLLSEPIQSPLQFPTTAGIIARYDPDAQNLFDRFLSVPDSARRGLISDRFAAGKQKSFWEGFDAFWAHAAHAAEAGRLNWLADIYNCLPVNNPVFTVDRGYAGDGSTSYLDTQFNPATAVGANYQQNSGALGIRNNTDAAGTGSLAGYYSSTAPVGGTTINPRTSGVSNDAQFRLNQGSTGLTASGVSPSAIGMYVASRTGATTMRGFRNGVSVGLSAEASVALINGAFRLGSINNSSYRAAQFSMGFIGRGFTPQEVQDIYDWFEPYRIAVGVT